MNWEAAWDGLPTTIISASVIAAAISGIINSIITLMNNKRLKSIEHEKKMTDIQKYRYTNLYDLVKHWNDYLTKVDVDATLDQITSIRFLNSPLENINRYSIARPLLHPKYFSELDELVSETDRQFRNYMDSKGKKHDERDAATRAYGAHASNFEEKLKNAINEQLSELLEQDEKNQTS